MRQPSRGRSMFNWMSQNSNAAGAAHRTLRRECAHADQRVTIDAVRVAPAETKHHAIGAVAFAHPVKDVERLAGLGADDRLHGTGSEGSHDSTLDCSS